MSLQYIIDGYNVVKHQLFRPSHQIKDDKKALVEFIKYEKLCGSSKNRVTVVFDGYPEGGKVTLDEASINIIFSREATADDKIKKMVEASGNPRIIRVVSDDKEIGFFIKAIGARWLSVEEFLSRKKSVRVFDENDAIKLNLNFTQMDKINKELKQLWLK